MECTKYICGNGICIDGINNYTCNCSAGFTGRKLVLFIFDNFSFVAIPRIKVFLTVFENGKERKSRGKIEAYLSNSICTKLPFNGANHTRVC